MATPRFDEPDFTLEAEKLFADRPTGLPLAPSIEGLVDPETRPVTQPSAEPMALLEHRRIRTLNNYWHGGWKHAIAQTWLRHEVADRLGRLADGLPHPWGLAVFDGWRSTALQTELYETAIADPRVVPGFMAPPSTDPLLPSPHLSGGSVDLTLTYRGTPLALGCNFDDTTDRAYVISLEHTNHPGRELRRFLFHEMAAHGFVVYPGEWWHFEYGTVRWAAVTGGQARYAATHPS
jgi:D-alanyl-D-alanine dipeptidase